MSERERPLEGLRVIEMGQLLAGPFTGTILAYFGAEVIKVEPPGGDPIRGWREVRDGTSLWYRSLGRNKKSVTLDLKTEQGRALARRLLETADVVVENFRPGLMESWGMGPAELKQLNPGLVYARISGYGQTGPYASKPGYASVTEGFGGFRYINGEPGKAPVRPNISMGDTLSGIHAALGIALALIQRAKPESGEGQVVDVALYESVFNLMEGIVPEYDGAGVVREPSGTTVTGIVPTNTYRCDDGKYVVIGGNGDSIFKRLMTAAGRSDMAENPAMASNAGRIVHEDAIDSVQDMLVDPQYQARGLFESVEIDGRPLRIPAIMPKLDATPGRTDWPGMAIGSHNDEVLRGILKLDDAQIERLRADGVIG